MGVSLVADWPPGAPGGVCYLCRCALRDVREAGGFRRERVVDLGVHIDWEGPLACCETCAVEIGRTVGMTVPAEAATLEADVHRLRAELDQEVQRNADLHAAVEGLHRAGYQTVATSGYAQVMPAVDGELAAALTAPDEATCDVCGHVAKNELGLKQHRGKAHREPTLQGATE